MALKIRSMKDFSAGLMFIIAGAMFAIGANQYPMGTAVRMGPAYFPSVLGWILVALGVIVFVRSFYTEDEEAMRKTNYRPLLLIVGSVFVFGYLLDTAGLVV